MNSVLVIVVERALKQVQFAGILFKAFTNIINVVQCNEEPEEPKWKADELDALAAKAWNEQEKIGWLIFFKGRISIQWEKAQGYFYEKFADTSSTKMYTVYGWCIWVSKEKTDMILGMWKNQCQCLH